MLAAVCWGLIGPVARLAFEQGIAPLEVAFWRANLAWLLFGGQAIVSRKLKVAPKDLPLLLLFALTGISLFYSSYQVAVDKGGAALASVLLYTAPAWVVLLAGIIWREPIDRVKLVCLLLTLTGVVLIAEGGLDRPAGHKMAAIGYGLTAGFCYALYYIFGKYFSNRYDAATIFFYMLPVGALFLLPWVPFSHKTPLAWLALSVIALVSTYAAYHFYYLGLRHLEPGRASITATLEPVVAAVVAYFWWQESFSVAGYGGSAMILLAVVLMVRQKTSRDLD